MSNEPEQETSSSRRGLWIISGIVGVAVIALVIWLVARDDDSSTDIDPSDNSSEMDEMTDEPTDEMTHDMDDDMDDDMSDEPTDDMTDDMDDDTDDSASAGVYRDYEPDLVAAEGFDRTILFFHAEWCPECRAFEQELTSAEIPEGVQFLKVDYDTSDLVDEYGVTIQTTFVEVDDDGEEMSTWVGYEEDRSVDTIFAGLDG